MEKIRRNERMSAMMKILSSAPNRIYTLNSFCEMFSSAKSTMSEDVDLLRKVCEMFDLGKVETVTGAAGGVRYSPSVSRKKAREMILELCEKLSGTERVLPGGFLYYSDILSTPDIVNRMGEIIASEYAECGPDFVLTMETKGIPVAFATANALGIPLVIARHSSKVYEGSAVNINYVSGSGSIETMSLSRRAVKENQRALIVDDFLKGGGTAKGMVELMREFNVTVAGMAFVMATVTPEKKRISGEKSLMTLSVKDGEPAEAVVRPADWLREDLPNKG
jgi:purine operon repressor